MATRFLCPRLGHIKILCVLTFIILTASSAVATAQSPLRLGIPSLDPNDGRFLAIAGFNVGTLANVKIVLYVGAPAGETSLQIGIFDGDVGGNWDYVKPGESASCTYTIYPDPTKSGTTTFGAPIALNDSMMLNDGWFFHTIPLSDSSPAKNTSSGNYFFRIEVEFVGSNSLNAFKIGTSGQPSLAPMIGQMGFIASPSPLESPVSRYDGKWTFYPYAHPNLPSASFWDGDADSADDLMQSPDSRIDDSPYRIFRIPPNIYYVLTDPSGTQYPNFNPSGDNEWEEFPLSGDPLPAGFYRWEWFGVDHGNLVFIRSDLEIFMTTESPLNGTPPPGGGPPPQQICGKVTGHGLNTSGIGNGQGGFNVQCDNKGGVQGELQFQNATTKFHAHQIDSLVVSLDLKKAWFSGVGKDGRRFDAYVEDNGESGINDVFLITIGGVLQSGSGPVTKGNIQIHK